MGPVLVHIFPARLVYLGREIRSPRVLSFREVPRASHNVRHEEARPSAVFKVLLGEHVGVVVAVVEGVVVTVVLGVVVGVVVDLAVLSVLLLTQVTVPYNTTTAK